MTDLLLPPGRLVAGSLVKPNTTDWQGNPLTTKTGPNAGQPRIEYFFAVAIAKGAETHWSQSEWGQVIYGVAAQAWPGGEAQRPDFSWKITDGDSQVPNKRNVAPCTKVGYPGHWVIGFSSGFAPNMYTADGTQQLMAVAGQPDPINCGDYVQVFCKIASNMNQGNPGIYINHSMVALAGFGERITSGPDAAAVGFGGAPLPVGASATPLAGGFNPAVPSPSPLPPTGAPVAPLVQQPAPIATPATVSSPAPVATPVVPAVTPGPAPIAPVVQPAVVAPVVPAGNYLAGQ